MLKKNTELGSVLWSSGRLKVSGLGWFDGSATAVLQGFLQDRPAVCRKLQQLHLILYLRNWQRPYEVPQGLGDFLSLVSKITTENLKVELDIQKSQKPEFSKGGRAMRLLLPLRDTHVTRTFEVVAEVHGPDTVGSDNNCSSAQLRKQLAKITRYLMP